MSNTEIDQKSQMQYKFSAKTSQNLKQKSEDLEQVSIFKDENMTVLKDLKY